MNLSNSFNPAPKPVSKKKEKPKFKTKKPKKKKNPYLYRGRIIPKQKDRTKITPEQYNKMIEVFGAYCQECGYTPIHAHHLVFRSNMGTGNWRNLAPLCERCHSRAHKDFEFAESLREKRVAEYGPLFHHDKWSLFQMGLLPNTEDISYERFMQVEEKQAKETQHNIITKSEDETI